MLEAGPRDIGALPGIGPKRADKIHAALQALKASRES